MRLFDEIVKSFKKHQGENAGELTACARYTLLHGYGAYFQGVKGVYELSDARIILALKRGYYAVEGSGLEVEKYCDGDLRIGGEIASVRFLEKLGEVEK
jgi:hypothetical protein